MLVKNIPNEINKNWKAGLDGHRFLWGKGVDSEWQIYPMSKECYFILLCGVASWQLESLEKRLIFSQSP